MLLGLVSRFQKHAPFAKDVQNAGVSSFVIAKNGADTSSGVQLSSGKVSRGWSRVMSEVPRCFPVIL